MPGSAPLPTSFACLPTSSERFWTLTAVRRDEQKLGHVNRQRGSQAIKQIDGWIEFVGLYFANRSPINSGVESEGLLTDPLRGSNASKVPCDAAASIHAEDATNLQATNLSDIADIFGNSTVRRESASKEMSGEAVPLLEVTVGANIGSGGVK